MNLAFAIPRWFKTGLKPSFRASLHPSSFVIQPSNTPLSPQTPSHPVSAPRPGPPRPAPVKSNFLADRASGGRSFNFSGLDAHHAWELDGIRKLVINGILWSTGVLIPASGAKSEADKALVDSFLTPRIAPLPTKAKVATK